MNNDLKPKHRSKLRLFIGKKYYIGKRYITWFFGNIKFSHVFSSQTNLTFPYEYIEHKTPLLRQLKDVDMHLQYNKITNLKLAIKHINHIIIYPGETFSYWKLIGKPTKFKGYKDGMILYSGSFKPGVGGGLCQLSNLLFWMTIHTPLTILERYRHSYDVFPDSNRTQPFGSGATCVYNYRDLMIKNETSNPFVLNFKVTDTELIGNIRSTVSPSCTYKVYEKDHIINKELWGGYSRHNKLYRKVYDYTGLEIADEFITENHAIMMYQPYLTTN
jgi:vancomycin resistance protein VanW